MFEIKTAERHGARLLIQLSGVSGSGKTFTALQIAYGLAGGDASKVIGIDTENRRMSLNADILPGGAKFCTIDFFAPFSPDRYIQAIEAACKAGAEVIVIDSVTHEWEGPGGCQEIAAMTKFPDWKRAKAEHKRFMTYMLQCPAHVIACTRAREKTDFTDTKNPVKLGIQPIQEGNFSYEATVSLMMHDQGAQQQVLKCPSDLQAIMGRGRGYLTADDGAALRAWVDGATPVNPKLEQSRGTLLNTTEQGLDAFKAAWNALTPAIRKALGTAFRDQCAASAQAYDDARRPGDDGDGAFDGLNEAAQMVRAKLPEATAPAPEPAAVPAPSEPAPAPATADSDDVF